MTDKIPERIYLQWHCPDSEWGVLCCEDKIFPDDVEYVRAPRWISVSERLPENGEYVYIHPPHISGAFPDEPRHVMKYHNGDWRYYMGDSIHNPYEDSITHWMPLPQPPYRINWRAQDG